ncbi:MAG TPA: hypothetical protein ENI27_02475 [bacterium]|nr:hypothetical protein [bacterium]
MNQGVFISGLIPQFTRLIVGKILYDTAEPPESGGFFITELSMITVKEILPLPITAFKVDMSCSHIG